MAISSNPRKWSMSNWLTALICLILTGILGIALNVFVIPLLLLSLGIEVPVIKILIAGILTILAIVLGVMAYGIVFFWGVRKRGKVV